MLVLLLKGIVLIHYAMSIDNCCKKPYVILQAQGIMPSEVVVIEPSYELLDSGDLELLDSGDIELLD